MAYLGAVGGAGQVLTVSGGAPVWQQPGWFTAYEIDFTAQTPQSFGTTGNKTIGGYTWNLNNIGANSTTALSAANGLSISTPNGVANQYTRWFSPNFSTLAGAGVLKSFDMQIWCYIEPNLPAGGTYAQLRISPQDDAGGANYVAVADMGYPTTGVGGTAGINVHPWMAFGGNFYPASIATGYSQGGVSATGPNVFALCFRSQMDFDLYTGTYSGGWPTLDTMTFRNTVRPSAISFAGSASVVAGPALNAFRLMYQLQTQSTTGTCTTYFKRFRLLTR